MTESNKDVAIAFLKLASSGQVDEAYSRYVGKGFRHHNPFFAGSAEALAAGLKENAQRNPNKTLKIHHAIAEGDYVTLHSHVRQHPENRGAVVVHVFRFEGGRIAELWDVGQPVPEHSVNENGLF